MVFYRGFNAVRLFIMKIILLLAVFALIWTNPITRQFSASTLHNIANFIESDDSGGTNIYFPLLE